MTKEQAHQIEQEHNVYVDYETDCYNHDGYDAVYGWMAIPSNWL
jgi:hypothetical protein